MGDQANIKDCKEKININRWLDKYIVFRNGIRVTETDYGTEVYTYGDYVNDFTSKICDQLTKEQYSIININEFREELIRFIYKYSDGYVS